MKKGRYKEARCMESPWNVCIGPNEKVRPRLTGKSRVSWVKMREEICTEGDGHRQGYRPTYQMAINSKKRGAQRIGDAPWVGDCQRQNHLALGTDLGFSTLAGPKGASMGQLSSCTFIMRQDCRTRKSVASCVLESIKVHKEILYRYPRLVKRSKRDVVGSSRICEGMGT